MSRASRGCWVCHDHHPGRGTDRSVTPTTHKCDHVPQQSAVFAQHCTVYHHQTWHWEVGVGRCKIAMVGSTQVEPLVQLLVVFAPCCTHVALMCSTARAATCCHVLQQICCCGRVCCMAAGCSIDGRCRVCAFGASFPQHSLFVLFFWLCVTEPAAGRREWK